MPDPKMPAIATTELSQLQPLHSTGSSAPQKTARGAVHVILSCLALFAACLFALPASAATIWTLTTTVDSNDGSCTGTCSLRDAILAANADSGDTIVSGVTGTITLLSPLPAITASMTIQGPGARLLTISGNNAYTVLTVNSGAKVAIYGLTIANGYTTSYGGGIYNLGTLTVTNSILSDNSTQYYGGGTGGGIFNSAGTVTVTNSTFTGNSAIFGGGIYNNMGTMTVTNSTFSGNFSNGGGSGGGISNNNYGTLTVTSSTFSGNSASGGYDIDNVGTMTVNNSVLADVSSWPGWGPCTGNSCPANGTNGNVVGVIPINLAPLGNYGGPTQTMMPQPGSPAICAGLTANIPGGVTTDQRGWPMMPSPSACPGGQIDAGAVQSNYLTVNSLADTLSSDSSSCTDGGTCSLRDALTQANTAAWADVVFAPALFLSGSPAVLTPGTVTLGSALPAIAGTLNLIGPGADQLTVSGNNSSAVGSVLVVDNVAKVSIDGLTIAHGNAPISGGGIYNYGTLTVTGSTLSGNQATYGSGIYNQTIGTLTVTGSTFSGNYAAMSGGIFNYGTLAVTGSTFSGNYAGFGSGIDNYGTLTVTGSTLSANIAYDAGGGISINGGTLTLANSIVAGNTSGGVANSGDCFNCGTQSSFNLIGGAAPALGSLAYSPASAAVQTMMPLPGATSILCTGSSALLPAGVTTDERGFPMDPWCSSAAIDLGAAQTHYTQVVATGYNGVVNQVISPSPTAELQETNTLNMAIDGVGGIPITIALVGNGSLSGTTTVTTAPTLTANGMDNLAVYPRMSVSAPGTGDTFSPMINGILLGGYGFGSSINQFDIDAATATSLAFGTPPASSVVAGGNAGTVTVQELSASGVLITSANDTIALTVTGPNGYAQAYELSAINGVATFNLSVVPLIAAGTYSYSAALTTNASVKTASPVTETVTTVPVGLAVTGYPAAWSTQIASSATVEAVDQFGNVAAGYSGSATVTTSDSAAVITPNPVTLSNGVGTVTVTFNTVGSQSIIASDSASILTSGSETGIQIALLPPITVTTIADDTTDVAANCQSGSTNPCSLRDAIAAANAGSDDTIIFQSGLTGTMTLSSALPAITTSMTILGPGTRLLTVSGNNAYTVFTVNSGTTVAISGLTIANANSTTYYGGGIYNNGTLTVTGSAFSGNSAPWGGGIFSNSTLTVTGSTFSGNSATTYGGGISNYNGTLTVTNSTFSGNSTNGYGAGIFNKGTVTVTNSTFSGNSATAYGGGIYNSNGTVTVTGSTFFGNSSPEGGGIFHQSGTLTVTGSTLSGNSTQYGGAGIYNTAVSMTLVNSIVAGNTTGGVANSGDCKYCGTQDSHNLIGGAAPALGSLAYSPANAGVQTMMPLPQATSILCKGSSALLPAGVTTDARGFPMDPSCSSSAIDMGAAQTHYTRIVVQPYNAVKNQVIAPAPTVQVQETNALTGAIDGVGGIPITLALTPNGSPSYLSGAVTETTVPTLTANGMVAEASFGGLAVNTAGTYTFTVISPVIGGTQTVSSQFNIAAATPAISWATPAAVAYGTTLGNTQLNATANTPGTFVYTPAAGTIPATGTDTLSVTFTPADTTNYTTATATVSITVNRAPLTVIANDLAVPFGVAIPELSGTLTGEAAGDGITASYSTTAVLGSPVGNYAIAASLNDPNGKLSNYSVTITNGNLVIYQTSLPLSLWLSPNIATAGDAGVTLTVRGANFVSDSMVLWNGGVRATTYVSSTQLTAAVLDSDLAKEGTNSVSVASPAPNAATSAGQPFLVMSSAPVATITGGSLAIAADGNGNHALTLSGTNFIPDSIVQWAGTALATTYVSPWQISAVVTALEYGSVSATVVTVANPAGSSAGIEMR